MAAQRQWQVQEAKSRLSALIAEAQRRGPQSITKHGHVVAVLLSAQDYQRLVSRRVKPLVAFLASAPLAELELPERSRTDFARDLGL